MKPSIALAAVLLLSAPVEGQTPPAREVNSFAEFEAERNGGESAVNAYLLMYLSRLISPDRIRADAGLDPGQPTTAAQFAADFVHRTKHYFTDGDGPQPPGPPVLPDAPCVGAKCPCNRFVPSSTLDEPGVKQRVDFLTANPLAPGTQLREVKTRGLPNGYVELRSGLEPRPRVSLAAVELSPRKGVKPGPTCRQEIARYEAAVKTLKLGYEADYDAYLTELDVFAASQPQFTFLQREDLGSGYDSEVMVVSSPNAVLVVFRGTDRVNGASTGIGYELGEWWATDLDFVMVPPGDGLAGLVHRGFWQSLSTIKRQVAEAVTEAGGATKPVWITGHSLGGAHAQLFAAYLTESEEITPHGVYVFGSPHVGNAQFVAELDGMLPGRLQRYEFMDDFATGLPPYVLGAARAGTRNHFPGLEEYRSDVDERIPVLDTPLNFCRHHTEWYVRATYNRVDPATRGRLPAPPPVPDEDAFGCSFWDILLTPGA